MGSVGWIDVIVWKNLVGIVSKLVCASSEIVWEFE